MITDELKRQLRNAWLISRTTVTGEIVISGRTVTVSYEPAGISRYRFRWKIDGRRASFGSVQLLESS